MFKKTCVGLVLVALFHYSPARAEEAVTHSENESVTELNRNGDYLVGLFRKSRRCVGPAPIVHCYNPPAVVCPPPAVSWQYCPPRAIARGSFPASDSTANLKQVATDEVDTFVAEL